MTNDYDGLRQASGGDVRPTAELLGQTFTIIDFEDIETRFQDAKGGNKSTHIATLTLEGEEEQVRYWLGGVVLNRQLAWLKTTGRLPFRLKLGGKGNQEAPYELVEPGAELRKKPQNPEVERPKTKPKVDRPKTFKDRIDDPLDYFRTGDGKLDSKAFMQWWEEEGGLTSNDLASVIGKPTMTALEAWFAADLTRTVQGLVDEAAQRVADDEALPFE
jgi:hypothetical protein